MELQPHLDISIGKLEEICGTTVDGNIKEQLLRKIVFILLPPSFHGLSPRLGKEDALHNLA